MYELLKQINTRPAAFEFYTAEELWTDPYTSEQMLAYHLNEDVDLSSRNHAFIDRSVDWIADRFQLATGKRVADFGCGPGLYTTRMARRGADVTGIDFSERSIRYAMQTADDEGLQIEYARANYLDFETDLQFDLITMIMCDFCALGPEQRSGLLNKFRELLAPGGSVLLDVYSLHAFDGREEQAIYEENLLHGFWSASPYYGFLNTMKYEQEKVVLDKYTIIEAERVRTVYNWLQYFSRDAIEQEFAECGLSIGHVYSNVAGDAYDSTGDEWAIVAKRDVD